MGLDQIRACEPRHKKARKEKIRVEEGQGAGGNNKKKS